MFIQQKTQNIYRTTYFILDEVPAFEDFYTIMLETFDVAHSQYPIKLDILYFGGILNNKWI
jgi:hypothetical protein